MRKLAQQKLVLFGLNCRKGIFKFLVLSVSEPLAKLQRLQPITKEDTGETEPSESDDSEAEKETEDEFELQPVDTKPQKKKKKKKEKVKTKRKKVEENETERTKPSTKKKKKKKPEKEEQKKKIEEEWKSGKSKKMRKKGSKSENGKEALDNEILLVSQTENSDTEKDKNENSSKDKEQKSKRNVLHRKRLPVPMIIPSFEVNNSKQNGSTSKEIKVNPKKFFRIEDHGMRADNEELGHLNENSQDRQMIDIRQAFANDDVIEQFAQEKDDIIEASAPKEIDLTLPGWGEWAGAGVKPSVRKKKKFVTPAVPAPPRKDRDLAHVIINEERNKRFAKHQVNKHR